MDEDKKKIEKIDVNDYLIKGADDLIKELDKDAQDLVKSIEKKQQVRL